jgi:3-methyladenine DNA glycosylase/8-oxoguanine DNA glycosylase
MKPSYWNKGINYLSNKDKVLKKLIKTYKKEHLNLNNNYFHSLINSVIGQQISVSAAHSIKNKFFSIKKNITPLNV